MSKKARLLFLAFATVALGWAQAFGLQRGYYCDCTGSGHLTMVNHCHVSSAELHDHDHDHDLPHEHDGEDEQDTHEHPPVVDTLLAQNHSFLQVQAPPLMLWEAGWIWQPLPFLSPTLESASELWRLRAFRRCTASEDWPHQLSQAISLRL
jgi:hypothetical protein